MNDSATLLGINCLNLNPSVRQVRTANGTVTPFEITDAILIFAVKSGFLNLFSGYHGTNVNVIHCYAPTNPQLMTQQRAANAFSLLGMDVLSMFKTWKWNLAEEKLLLST